MLIKRRRRKQKSKTKPDNLIYAAKKLVKQDLKDKMKPEHEEKINKSSQELKDAIATNNIDNIKATICIHVADYIIVILILCKDNNHQISHFYP